MVQTSFPCMSENVRGMRSTEWCGMIMRRTLLREELCMPYTLPGDQKIYSSRPEPPHIHDPGLASFCDSHRHPLRLQ